MKILMRSGKNPTERYSPGTALATNYMGDNLGNLVFTNASHWLLTTSKQETVSNHLRINPDDALWINDNFDAFVIPLANAFRPSFQEPLKRLTKLISELEIPVMVLGVGAQAPLSQNFSGLKAIDEDVKNFMNAVLEKSARVGVRGEVTQKYLSSLGYSEVDIIGCPSMFIDRDQLPGLQNKIELDEDSKIALTFSPYVKKGEKIVESSSEEYKNLDYFVQDIYTMRTIVTGTPKDTDGRFPGIPDYWSHPLFVNGRARFHVDPISWMNDLKSYDFSFGTRIHGTIAALTSGIPATLIAHDSRTSELAEYFGIPYVNSTSLTPETKVSDLSELWDSSNLIAGHAERFNTISNFIKLNGFEVATRSEMENSISQARNQKALAAEPTMSNSKNSNRMKNLSIRNRLEIAKFMTLTPSPKNRLRRLYN
jgi:hypothetical protein